MIDSKQFKKELIEFLSKWGSDVTYMPVQGMNSTYNHRDSQAECRIPTNTMTVTIYVNGGAHVCDEDNYTVL